MAKKIAKLDKPFVNRIIGHGEERVEDMLANPLNFRLHPDNQQQALAGSIDDIGFIRSVTVNKRTGRVVDGHLRVTIAARSNVESLPVEYVDLTEAEEAQALLSLDPIAGLAASDKAKLDELMRAVQSDDERVQQMMADLAEREGLEYGREPQGEDPGAQVDKAEELRVKWGVESGQLWKLGEHRLICGDCTDRAVVERVMGGEKAEAIITDPPYGIGDLMHGGTWAKKADIEFSKMREWDNDTSQEFFDLILACDVPSIVWGGNYFITPASRCWLVWDKPEFPTMSSAELAWTNLDHNTKRFEYGRTYQAEGSKDHPTQKPVALMDWCLSFIETAKIIYEPFSGSGTTLIACERLSRKCRAIEISPAYVAVTIQRWADMTGKTPELVTT